MSENDSEIEELSPKQEKLIQALIAGNTVLTAAKMADISERQAHRWLKLPYFQCAYRSAQKTVFDESLSHLLTDSEDARATLAGIMKDVLAPHGARVRAAQIILDLSLETHKIAELEARLAELEGRQI